METPREKLAKRLDAIELEIQETKRRLPAHSIKPPIMMELLALEDEAHEIRETLKRMGGENGSD